MKKSNKIYWISSTMKVSDDCCYSALDIFLLTSSSTIQHQLEFVNHSWKVVLEHMSVDLCSIVFKYEELNFVKEVVEWSLLWYTFIYLSSSVHSFSDFLFQFCSFSYHSNKFGLSTSPLHLTIWDLFWLLKLDSGRCDLIIRRWF